MLGNKSLKLYRELENKSYMERKFILGERKGAIAKDGKTEYSVFISKDADASVRYAAGELVRLVKLATGAELPVITEKKGKVISLGNNELSAKVGLKATTAEITRHGFKIKTFGNDVVIVSSSRTGIIYAMQRYLELNMGYMYYHWEEVHYGDELTERDLDVVDFPDFLNRDVFSYDTLQRPENHIKLYNCGCALNSSGDPNVNMQAQAKYGEGSWWSSLHDQSLALQLVDYRVYRERYPHWYFGKEGGSNGTNPHICYTEALYSRDEYEKGDWNEPNYADGRHGLFWTLVYNLINKYIAVETDKSFFQLGMSDNYDFCNCERCNRDVEKYTRSGIAIRFANAVADEVEKWRKENCPEREIYLTMFAYLTIVDPPVVKSVGADGKPVWTPVDDSVIVRDNIVIRYAPIGDYYMFSFLDEKKNPGSYNALNGWTKVAKHFAVWDYRVDFGSVCAPFPQWLTAQDNIRLYKKLGFIDVFHQACRTSGGLPFISMDNWVRSRMLWDTTLEYRRLADEFIDVFYGPAGEAIKEYIEFLTEHYKRLNREYGYKAHSHYSIAWRKGFFPLDFVHSVEEIFKKGYKALAPLEESEPERYAVYKKRFDGESMFYRFCKLSYHCNAFDREELAREAVIFKAAGEALETKVWYNTFDTFWTQAATFLLQFTEKGVKNERD